MTKTILIIEDNPQNSQLMADVARMQGYAVVRAKGADDGIYFAYESNPCLILLDMRLPNVSGWQFAEAVRTDPALQNIPIIAVSVEVEASDRARAIEAGCNAFLSKPFGIKQLRDLIQEYAVC